MFGATLFIFALGLRPSLLGYTRSHLQKYKDSFFPSSVSLWNKLPDKAKCSVTLTEFKNHLSQVFPSNRPPTFFSIGPRYLSVLHTRLRLGQSLLKAHLFKIGLCDTPV